MVEVVRENVDRRDDLDDFAVAESRRTKSFYFRGRRQAALAHGFHGETQRRGPLRVSRQGQVVRGKAREFTQVVERREAIVAGIRVRHGDGALFASPGGQFALSQHSTEAHIAVRRRWRVSQHAH